MKCPLCYSQLESKTDGHALEYFTVKKIGCLNDKNITISPTLFKKYLNFVRNKKGEVL